jgi:hypothetical protein
MSKFGVRFSAETKVLRDIIMFTLQYLCRAAALLEPLSAGPAPFQPARFNRPERLPQSERRSLDEAPR